MKSTFTIILMGAALLLSSPLLANAVEEPVCTAEHDPAFALRKSVAVLNIAVAQPGEASDMPQLGAEVARYLQQALSAGEAMRVRDGSDYALEGAQINLLGHHDASLPTRLAALARELESQLIVSGRIIDLSRHRVEETPMDTLLGRLPGVSRLRPERRHFALELSVYDGHSGAELLTRRFHTQAEGRVNMSGLRPLSGDFLASDYGRAVGELLGEASERLKRSLSCIPMMARITDIEEKGLRIDDGNGALLRPGDRLRIFHRRYIGVDELGRERFQEEYIGDARVTHSFPRSALLELDDNSRQADLRPGDVARAW